MAAPKEDEKELLNKFRERLQDLELEGDKNSDMFLIRWIRARDHNLDAAEDMLRKAIEWRKEKNVDNYKEWKIPEEFHELLVYEVLGYDAENSPVVVVPSGNWNLKKVAREYGAQAFVDYKITKHEELLAAMKGKSTPEGVPVTQSLFIVDIKNVSISQTSLDVLEMLKQDARVYEAYYPEVMKACHMINAPWFFSIFFNILKPFMSQKTSGKMYVYDSNPNNWMPIFKDLVPAQVLPSCYGGLNDKARINHFYQKA